MTLARLLLAVFLVVAWASRASAQQRAELRADVDEETVAVGDVIHLRLQAQAIDGSLSDPRPGTTSGFTVRGTSVMPSTSISIVNGVRTDRRGIDASWALHADRAGTFRIGPPSVAVGGVRQAARVITVTVVPPGRAPARPRRGGGIFDFSNPPPINPMDPFKGLIPGLVDDDPREPSAPTDPKLALDAPRGQSAFLHAVVDKPQAVVGEQVTLSVYLYEDASERGSEFNDVHEVTAGDFLKRTLLENDAQARPIGNALVGGRLWTVKLARKSALFPLKTGNLEIGPMMLAISRARGGDPKRESEVLRVQVREPKVAGRPPGYVVGDVGHFALGAEVLPREIERGGAVGVNLELSGTGNLPSTLPVPARAGVEWLEPEVHEKLGATRDDKFGGKRTFSYVVRVKNEGDVDLGEVALPYWDPDASAYAVARVALGVLHVAPGQTPAASADQPPEVLPGLPPPFATRAATRRAEAHFADSPTFWLGLVAAPLAFALFAGARAGAETLRVSRASRATSPAAERRARIAAADAACRSGDARGGDAAISRALEWALIAGVGVNPRAAAGDALARELLDAGVSDDDARAAEEVYRACESARFSPDSANIDDVRARWTRARTLIDALGDTPRARSRARE